MSRIRRIDWGYTAAWTLTILAWSFWPLCLVLGWLVGR